MAKDTYHGPLEQVDECCWRIPKSYKPGMRVDGLDLRRREYCSSTLQKDQAPEQVANVAFLPGIQHASLAMPDIHWGYGFCIGGVCATDPGRGRRHLARRRRLRHQLRRPAGAHQPLLSRRQAAPARAGRRAVPQHSRPASASRAGTRFDGKELRQLLGEGPRYLIERGPGDAARHRVHRGRRPARRRRPRPGQRPRPGPRRRAVRHARLGQPLPRSAGRRSRLRRGRRRRSWAWKRTWSA